MKMKEREMKKELSAVLAAAMLCTMSVQCADDITVMLDNNKLEFDVPPQIINDRTFVPLRKIFEAMGAEVEWDGDARKVTATKADTVVEMTIDNNVIKVNSEEVTLDVPPQIVEDRTLVPARAVAESFGATVGWDGDTRTVTIVSAPPSTEPEPTTAPTAAPESTFPIEYDPSIENKINFMSNFKFTSVQKNANGEYEIAYSLSAYREDSGEVVITFNCLDKNGNVVDTFEDTYMCSAYAWTPQDSTAIISGDTVKIEVVTK